MDNKVRGLAGNPARYPSQSGLSKCFAGFIDDVAVDETPVNARERGNGKVLSIISLIDSELKKIDEAKIQVDLHEDKKIQEETEKGCSNFVALRMSAKPFGGGDTYFSAAARSG